MKRMKKLITLILSIIVLLTANIIPIVSAEEIEYTDVFDDLRKDKTFNAVNYPSYTYEDIKTRKEDEDGTNDIPLLDVISIAEGYNKELYIYVYNPTRATLNFDAKQISMYCENVTNPKDTFTPKLYDLELVSTYQVFDKYIVKDYVVCDEAYRYYNIVEISRPFIRQIDASIIGGTINDKAEPIGQYWCAYYFNDELVYEKEELQVVVITPTLTDYVFCQDGFQIKNLVGLSGAGHCHYIAFNVENYNVDKIFDADLTFDSVNYKYTKTIEYTLGFKSDEYETYTHTSEEKSTLVTLYSEDKVTYQGEGLWAKKFSYNRIMTAQDFVTNFESQDGTWNAEAKETLLQSQYVFAFTETQVNIFETSASEGAYGYSTTTENGTEVFDVDILRLHFMAEGKIYNLGVVADKTTADKIAGGLMTGLDSEFFKDSFEKIGMLIGIIGLLVLLIFVSPILKTVFKTIFTVVKMVINGILTVVLLPFTLIGKLIKPKRKIKKRSKRKD